MPANSRTKAFPLAEQMRLTGRGILGVPVYNVLGLQLQLESSSGQMLYCMDQDRERRSGQVLVTHMARVAACMGMHRADPHDGHMRGETHASSCLDAPSQSNRSRASRLSIQ